MEENWHLELLPAFVGSSGGVVGCEEEQRAASSLSLVTGYSAYHEVSIFAALSVEVQ